MNRQMHDASRSTAFIVCGSPGAGKTTYGQRLSRERSAVFLDIDTVTERIVQAGLKLAGQSPNDRDSPTFKQAFRQPIYDTLFDIARENLAWCDVVMTGPFTTEIRNPNWLVDLGDRLQHSVEVHYVCCEPEVRRQRLIDRGNPRDRPKLEDWPTYLQYYGAEHPPACPHVHIDTSDADVTG
ncbi:MAG: ATP-binding protein [Cyanobacteria bacterium J06597_1]